MDALAKAATRITMANEGRGGGDSQTGKEIRSFAVGKAGALLGAAAVGLGDVVNQHYMDQIKGYLMTMQAHALADVEMVLERDIFSALGMQDHSVGQLDCEMSDLDFVQLELGAFEDHIHDDLEEIGLSSYA